MLNQRKVKELKQKNINAGKVAIINAAENLDNFIKQLTELETNLYKLAKIRKSLEDGILFSEIAGTDAKRDFFDIITTEEKILKTIHGFTNQEFFGFCSQVSALRQYGQRLETIDLLLKKEN